MYKEAYDEAYEKASAEANTEAYEKAYVKAFDKASKNEKHKRIISTIEVCQELGIEKSQILKPLVDKFSISENEALNYLKLHWN